jgi:Asp-tRNA(Asn)/Glu-tRNA(Gln) amidotransferase A subunit family amidase
VTLTATELWQLSAVELAAAIRSRRASCREVVEAHLRRTEAVNPAVNAVVLVLGEQALDAADAIDLPQVVQVIGPRYREDLCLDAAAAVEDRLGILTPIDPR